MPEQNIALWGWDATPGAERWRKIEVTAAGLLRIDMAGISLGDLGDVNPVAPADNDSLTWDAASGLWLPEARLISVGGLYGINVETLTGDKTLTPGTDKIYQYLDEGGADRDITLDTASASAGDRFVIRHNGDYNDTHTLEVKQAATSLDYIYAGGVKEFVFDGTDWISRGVGTGEDDNKKYNVAIGRGARVYNKGVAVGYGAGGWSDGVGIGEAAAGYTRGAALGDTAYGYNYGAAVGYSADGYNYGVGVGYQTEGRDYGIAIGAHASSNVKRYSIALGYYSKTERDGETSTNIDGLSTQKNNVVQGRWAGTTTDATPAEIFLRARAGKRFTIRAISALAFKMTIVARDNVANEVAMYTVVGIIKRDGANNTVMSNCTVTTVFEDDATWDVAVTADDTNEALIITVTGDATNPVQWAVRMDGVETHF